MSEVDPRLLNEILLIKEPVSRNPGLARKGSTNFLREAQMIAKNVSFTKNRRHTGVKEQSLLFGSLRVKERSPMLNTILSILLAVTLFLGTGVATVAASQGSQPDDLLYEVKLASESAFMNLTSDPAAQFDLSLDYVETRAEEIILMMLEGEQPSTQVLTRYQAQVEKAMAIAVGLDDQNAIDALEQLQIRLESQNRVFTELQKNASPDSENALTQIHTMLEERVRQIDTGQTNLLQLRQQIQVQEQLNNPDQGQQGQSAENGPQSTTSSGDGNPWTEGTPTPNSGFGPGPGECDTTCTPQGDGEGNNPQSFGTPVPNTNYGYSYWWWLTKTPVGQNGKH